MIKKTQRKSRSDTKWYALYNHNEELVMVGTATECSKFIGFKNVGVFYCYVTRIKKGKWNKHKTKYLVYEIEEDEEKKEAG